MEGSALLQAIIAAPDDDAPRMVFADWLAQQGDPLGELIALQVRLARADADDTLLPERRRVEARIRALLKEHATSWTAPLRAIASATYSFRRGFVEEVAGYADANFGFVAGPLLDRAPLLRAARVQSGALYSMFMNEAPARFAELVFEQPDLDVHRLARLSERLQHGALQAVEFERPHVADRDVVRALAAWPIPVRHFGVAMSRGSTVQLTGSFLEQFAAAPGRTSVRSLRLQRVDLRSVRAPTGLGAVDTLALVDCQLGRQSNNVTTIVRAMPELTSLALSTDTIERDELEQVIEACPRLRRLVLRHMHVTAIEPVLSLAPQLRRLDITGNRLGDAAARALLATDWPHLVELRFPMRGLAADTTRALEQRFADVLA